MTQTAAQATAETPGALAERRDAVLRARARLLAEPVEQTDAAHDSFEVRLFRLGGEHIGPRSLCGISIRRVFRLGGAHQDAVGGEPRLLDGGEMLLHQLVLADRLAVLMAFLGVGDTLRETVFNDA